MIETQDVKVGGRVSWFVAHPSHTRLKPAGVTWYGTVTKIRRDPLRGCPSCGHGGEEGVMVRPDDKPWEQWLPLRLLQEVN